MDRGFESFLMVLAVIVVVTTLPIVPAWLTFRITPNQALTLKGPFKGLTLNATGAFVAYLVVVLIIVESILPYAFGSIKSVAEPTWTLDANLVVIDRDGRRVARPPNLGQLDVTYQPKLLNVDPDHVQLRLPGYPDQWPAMVFTIPEFGGSEAILPSKLQHLRANMATNHADLGQPLVIRQSPPRNQVINIGPAAAN